MTRSLFYRLGLSPETTAGTTDTNPTVYFLETSSASPSVQAPKQSSLVVRNDGNVKQHVPLNRSTGFGRSADLVYPTAGEGLFREIQAGLRAGSEAAQVALSNTGGDGTETQATDQIITTGDFVTEGVQKGDIVQVTNANASADNGFYVVASVDSATQLTVEGASWAGPGACDVKRGARLTNGTTDYSFTLEECWVESPYNMMQWTGQRVNTLALGFAMGQRSTISASYIGRDGTPTTMTDGAASPTPQGLSGTVTYNDYTESDVFTPANSITAYVDGAALPIRSLSVSTNNSGRPRFSTAGGATPDAIPMGMFRASFTIETYASVLDHIADSRLGTEVSIAFVMTDSTGRAIGVSMGTCVLDVATLPMGGADQDAMVSASGVATLTESETTASQDYADWTLKLLRFQ